MEDRTTSKNGIDCKIRLWKAATDLKSDPVDTSLFLVAAKECIESGHVAELADLVTSENFQDVTKHVGWEILGIVFPHLVIGPFKESCQKVMDAVCEICSPKEVILGLTEQLCQLENVDGFLVCMKYLKLTMLNLNRRRSKFTKLICGEVSKQMKKFTLKSLASSENICDDEDMLEDAPQATDAGEKVGTEVPCYSHCPPEVQLEKLDSERLDNVRKHNLKSRISDPIVENRLCCIVNGGLEFIYPLIEELSPRLGGYKESCCYGNEECNEGQIYIIFFLLNLLEFPLSWFPLQTKTAQPLTVNSECFDCGSNTIAVAQRILEYIFMLKLSFVELMRYQPLNSFHEEEDYTYTETLHTAKAMLCYLIFIEEIGIYHYPFILSPECLVSLCWTPIAGLLRRTDVTGAEKAMDLAENMIRRLTDSSLAFRFAEREEYLSLLKVLIDIMIYRKEKKLRQRALSLLSLTIRRFKSTNRLDLIRQLMAQVKHPGACGLLIQYIKDEANFNFLENISYFWSFLELALSPITDKDFDVIHQYDRIVAALNFLRFLLLRSTAMSSQRIAKKLPEVDVAYLSPLRNFIKVSRGTYTARLMELTAANDQGSGEIGESDDAIVSLEVDGVNLDQMSKDQNIQQVQIALNTLDIMESLLARISEISNAENQLLKSDADVDNSSNL